ncbi:MAG: hypothetical protein ACE14W_10920 [Candidatus Velamenicoccus archaeovorus]
MQQADDPTSPAADERARRRTFFSRSPAPQAPLDPRVEAAVAAYQHVVNDRLDQGIRAIREEAGRLMHEVAAEVWRSAGGDKDRIQAAILESISRDQAIRGLIAHSDERFQDLAVRTSRLEDATSLLTEQSRAAQRAMAEGVEALKAAASSPVAQQAAELRDRLEQMARQVAGAFETLAERDRAIVEAVRQRVQEHGELITRETGHIAEAMQAYVQQGVSAMGQLAARIEDQAATTPAAVQEQVHQLAEQLELVDERIGIKTRDLDGTLHAVEQRFEERVMGLARLIRSDSEAIREELVRVAAERDETLAGHLDRELGHVSEAMSHTLDEQLARVSEGLTAATRWTVEEMTRRLREETGRAIDAHMQDAAATIDRLGEAHGATIKQQLDQAVSTIDRNMVRMADTLDGGLDRLSETVGRQASEAADRAIGGRLDSALDRLDAAARTVDRTGADLLLGHRELEERLSRTLESRVAGLAKMIRSDNQALADRVQVAAEQEAAKQTLRAVKEVQANLPAEVMEIVELRVKDIADQLHRDMQSTAESVARLGDMLERKVDEMAARMDKRQENEIQVVIDRMGDAMHALASLGRPRREDRIELE